MTNKLGGLLIALSSLLFACNGDNSKPAQFRMNSASVEFIVTEGQQAPDAQSVEGLVTDDVDDPVYIFVDASSATLIADATVRISGQTGTLTLHPVGPKGIDVGNYSESVTVSVCFDSSCKQHLRGSPASISVHYTVEENPNPEPEPERRIYVPDNGIAFTQFKTKSHLRQSILVKESRDQVVTWNAFSNKPWLIVPDTGVTEDHIEITVEPSSLSEGLHFAQITFESEHEDINNIETVNVSVWVENNRDPEDLVHVDVAVPIIESDPLSPYDPMAPIFHFYAPIIESDPLRPYVYASNENGGVDVYHIYTQKLIKKYPDISTDIRHMEASSNGATLFILDGENQELITINLFNDTIKKNWPIKESYDFTLLKHKGESFVIMSNGDVYNPMNQQQMTTSEFYTGYHGHLIYVASLYGNRLCGMDGESSQLKVYCYDISFDHYYNQLTFTPVTLQIETGGSGRDIALNSNGNILYTASGSSPYVWKNDLQTNTSTELKGKSFPNAVDIDDNDTLHSGASVLRGDLDTWIYNSDGSLRHSAYTSGRGESIKGRQVKASGDGYITITSTTDPRLSFISSYK